ncbi:MAG: PLDc N-terminal domain-containing protein [Patescibacteria group bacterium]
MNELQVIFGLGGILIFMLYIWFFMLFWVIWMVVVIGGFVLWVMMLIDVSKREFPKPEDRTLWILVVALAGFIGAAIYYFSIKRPADKLNTQTAK